MVLTLKENFEWYIIVISLFIIWYTEYQFLHGTRDIETAQDSFEIDQQLIEFISAWTVILSAMLLLGHYKPV